MKDLIKEIEELRENPSDWDYETAIDDVIDILQQHNIITAPKQIKLSEIVSRLEEAFKDLCSITYRNLRAINRGFIYFEDEIVITIDLKTKEILNIEFTNTFIELKWLYTLWIANVEIIDDMEE